jgi:mersacidin/lichenicidin family type 2 lantibiotic
VNTIAWGRKSSSSRAELSRTELAELPEQPAGSIEELDDAYLDSVIGGLVLDVCFFCFPSPPPSGGGDPCSKQNYDPDRCA